MSTVEELGYSNLDYDEIVFPRLGIDVHVNPTAFTIFGVSIQWYGIIIVSGLLIALLFAFRNMKRIGIDPDRATDGIIGGILGALVGARAYYVLLNWDSYKGDWKAIINTREGGLAIFGGLIGAVIVGGIVCKLRKVRLLPMLDICGVGFLIGQGIGRWGNFTNQEAFGKNTDSLFCMSGGRIQRWITLNYNETFSYDKDVTLSASYPVHPCFLYESFWCLLGAVLLFIAFKKFRKFDGQIILMYMVWYGFGRFFIEGLRTDSLMIGNLRVSQALALFICIVALVLLIVQLSRVKRMGSDYVLYVDTEESKQLLAEAEARNQKSEKTKKSPEKSENSTEENSKTDNSEE